MHPDNPTNTAPLCTIPCNLCGGTDIDILATRDRNRQPLQTVICRACGLVWTDPRPPAEATRKFYAEQYRQQYKATLQPKLKHVYRDMLRAIQRFKRIESLLQPGMHLLDIGAGGGFFPYVVKQKGFAVTGLEPNAGYAGYGREEFQLDIKTGFIQEVDYDQDSFDLITLNHVLEHLEDPWLALTRIRGWLKPGGYLNVEVPNIEATYHAPGNKFHRAHLYNFNPGNLQRLGERAGFLVTDVQIVAGTRHINMMMQRPTVAASSASGHSYAIPGNNDRIRKICANHTIWAHYLSWQPYVRFLRKMLTYLREQLALRRFKRGRDVADYLLQHRKG